MEIRFLNGKVKKFNTLEMKNLADVDLRDAQLAGANLEGADLAFADLGGANLRGANLQGANQDGRIFLADIQEGLVGRLKDAKDEDDRKEAVRDAKRAAFNLGALDTYAELSKQPQDEFWDKERGNDGGYYTMWKLPEFCKASVDEFETLEGAYDAGTYEGEAAAERYNKDVLPREFEDAKRELAEAESDGNRFWRGECLDK